MNFDSEDQTEKIIQLLPADGWVAVYLSGKERIVSPLAAWALVEITPDPFLYDDPPYTKVVGLDGGGEYVESAENVGNFSHYEKP